MLLKKYVIGLCLLMLSAGSFAHGLMESPASRNWFCGAVTKPDEVANGTAKYPACGTAFAVNSIAGYSFMSVLTHNLGVSVVSPLPTNVCSADSETWKGAVTPWDVPMEWPTNPITAGKQDIIWNISWGPHFSDTLEFRYWITKSDFVFSPTKALTWSDFEATPFCVLPYDNTKPNANPDVIPDEASAHFTTKCTIPARTGHHVMYGEWGRQPVTYERFHGCVDLAFSGVSNPVTAAIAATPSTATVTGATTIAFSAAGSTGTNLTYQWAVESPNAALYSFSSTTAASTTLTLQAPAAQTALTVRLTVSNGTNSASKTLAFTHVPNGVYSFEDLGLLTAKSQTFSVGDKVQLRTVDSSGVDTYFPATPLTITSANSAATAWPYALAQAINGVNSKVQIGVLANNVVTPAQNATSNRVYAALPSNYISAFVNVVGANASSSSSSSSAAASSKSSSSVPSGPAQCNWYGTLYPLCTTTASGWGWENNKNCIASVTCAAQPAPYGVVGGASSTASSAASSTPASSASSLSPASSSKSSAVSTASSTSSTTGAGVLFQDNFESGAINTQPAGWDNYLSWIYNNSNTTSGTDYALIDNTKAYSGTKSIHFKGGLAEIVRALPAGTQRLHMRAYVNLAKKMGNDAADNHEHIMGIKKTKDANNEVRVGQIKGVLGTNDAPTDNIAPTMSKWYSGPQLSPNTWYCVETALYADTAYDQLYMWVNGTLVHSITSDADWNNGAIGANWMSDKFNYVMFGFHSFDNATSDVWMDDIVVSTQPIGCGTSTSSSSVTSSASSSKSSSAAVSSSSKSSAVATSSSKSSVASVASSSSKSSVASSSVASSLKSSSSSSVAVAGNCSYVVESEWNTAAQVNIVIKNNGTTPINGWNVSWKYANGTSVVSYFNAQVTGTNPYSASNLAWNGTIQPGQSVQFGFGASKGVPNTPAEKPVVTGAVCN